MAFRALASAAVLATAAVLCIGMSAAGALPDGRAYELVSRVAGGGREEGVSGVNPSFAAASMEGDAVDWEGFGGCCGATSGALNLYQSVRGSEGWQTRPLTPKPSEPLEGLSEEQAPMFWTSDLRQTVFATPSSYAAGDRRPRSSRAFDLYLQNGSGAMAWLSQGPSGTGTSPVSAEFDGATPNADNVVFSSAERLTANATGLGSENTPPQYLYLRDVAHETTTLLDVNNGNTLISPYGAILGSGSWLHEELVPTDYEGTTTNAISSEGTKVFFESPPPQDEVEGASAPHLYMRDLSTGTTTPLDNPGSTAWARYEGASTDGSLVFFTINEGLDGVPSTTELYEFNTTPAQIGLAPAMSAIPIGGGKGVRGETAISNDGSTVYFVSLSAVATNTNSAGQKALAGEPNLYAYDTQSGQTSFVATLAWPDVSACDPDCGQGHLAGLVAQPDLARAAYPTPDGSVLVFAASGDLTGQADGPSTTLSVEVFSGYHTLTVASTTGFTAGQVITIGTGAHSELDTIQSVDPPDKLTVIEYGPDGLLGLAEDHPAGDPVTRLHTEVYRYDSSDGSLVCVSCVPGGVTAAGSATLGVSDGGGSYAPDGRSAPISEDGSRVFFESPERLVSEAPTPSGALSPPMNVYEWEDGHVSLISSAAGSGSVLDGSSPTGDDVFFTTHARLVPGDTGSTREIYDARVGGGFPVSTGTPETRCVGETCSVSEPGGTIAPFMTPASVILGTTGGLEEQGPSPTIAVRQISPSQRSRLARTGRLALTVAATAAGAITVNATIETRSGGAQRVAHAYARITHAATVTLTLALDRTARAALARARTLTLSLEVAYSAGPTVKHVQIVLHAPPATDVGVAKTR
jgi:hypothetical protein